MIRIKPVFIFRKGTATQLSWIVNSYERNGTSMQVSFSLFDANKQLLESGIETLDTTVVSQWNSSDAVVDNAILALLGLEKNI
mgnify:CR=1 FL=1